MPMHLMDDATVELPLASARSEDLGRNAVRLPGHVLDALGLEEGDLVELEGRDIQWSHCLAAHPDDEGIDAARVDPTRLEGLGAKEGEPVRIRAAPVRPAEEVELDLSPRGTLSRQDIRDLLNGRVLLRGDTLRLGHEHELGSFEVGLSLVDLRLLQVSGWSGRTEENQVRVLGTVPAGPVRLVPETRIRLFDPLGDGATGKRDGGEEA